MWLVSFKSRVFVLFIVMVSKLVRDFDRIARFMKGEFIGLEVEVVSANNKDLIGLKGIVVDESKNLFEVEVEGNIIKKVFKGYAIFLFKTGQDLYEIDGNDLIARPWDRVKKKWQIKRL